MVRLNSCDHPFQLILDNEDRLMGTLTDGDVRRALLRGASLDDDVSECVHKNYILGQKGNYKGNSELLINSDRSVTFLPVVDEHGKLFEILINSPKDVRLGPALIMAGGFGTRLGERTRNIPKPLLPVGGRSILDHVISQLEEAGVETIYVAVHYLADQIIDFINSRKNVATISMIREDKPLGTAGALGMLPNSLTGSILVVNGDLITGVDYIALHKFHERQGLDATVGVTRYLVDVPFGVVRHGDDGMFTGIDEKPQISEFVAAGIYYLSSDFLALIPRGVPTDMPDPLNRGCELGMKIGLFPIHEYWHDVGRPADLKQVDSFIEGKPGSFSS